MAHILLTFQFLFINFVFSILSIYTTLFALHLLIIAGSLTTNSNISNPSKNQNQNLSWFFIPCTVIRLRYVPQNNLDHIG